MYYSIKKMLFHANIPVMKCLYSITDFQNYRNLKSIYFTMKNITVLVSSVKKHIHKSVHFAKWANIKPKDIKHSLHLAPLFLK